MRYLKILAVSKRLKATVESNRLRLKTVLIGIFIFIKQLLDSVSVSETISKVFGKGLSEELDVSDVTFISVSTGFDDSAFVVESTVKLIGKGESDTLTGSDSGTLLNQDYVDNPYYFADDYVGDKRIF